MSNIHIQTRETGLLGAACFFAVRGRGLPILDSVLRAKASLARRCWGVWAIVGDLVCCWRLWIGESGCFCYYCWGCGEWKEWKEKVGNEKSLRKEW